MQRLKGLKNQNTRWIIAGLLFFFLLAYGAYKRNHNFILGSKNTNSKEEIKISQEKKDSNNLYIDSSGFSFEYPKEYKILDITPGDNSYYSVVEVLLEKEATKSAIVIATDSSIPKIMVTVKDGIYEKPKEEKGEKEMLSFVSQKEGFFYLIESPKKEEWENTLDLIAKTFTLGVFPTPTPSESPSPTSGN